MAGGVRWCDDDGVTVDFAHDDADGLDALVDGLADATVSACSDCRSRVVSVLAVIDALGAGGAHPRHSDLIDLAEQAPTQHLYVIDDGVDCAHARWRDPGYSEWAEVVAVVRRPLR